VTARLTQIARQWHSRLRDFFGSPLDADATPLEISGAVLDELERRVQPVGGGRRVFPYDRIVVRIGQMNADRTALHAAMDGVSARLCARLGELQCDVPRAIDVKTVFLKKVPDGWPDGRLFSIECERAADAFPAADARRRRSLHVAVMKGAATQKAYKFCGPAIYVGRSEEATDLLGRVRRNDVAFLDNVDGVTETVGRAHARFQCGQETGEYRIFDDGSSNGTWIIRGAARIVVPAKDPRGVRVESGDEVRLGRALIRVSIESE
jgi:FHA domain